MHGDSLYWKYGGILFWTDFWLKMLLTFKASMPLLANLTFRNWRFLVSVGSPTLTALKSLFEEISKIIPWSRCPEDQTSVKCKVKVDSYKACSCFNDREYSFVRIWWRPNCKLTNGKSPSNETSCISGLLYFLNVKEDLADSYPYFLSRNSSLQDYPEDFALRHLSPDVINLCLSIWILGMTLLSTHNFFVVFRTKN